MYSQKIIERAERALKDDLGVDLVRYEDNTVDDMTAHLVSLVSQYDKEGNPTEWVRQPSKQEWDYITNERLLCKIDFQYWARRYAVIELAAIEGKPTVDTGRLGITGFMRPQEVFLEKLAKSEDQMYEKLDRGEMVDGLRYFINKGRQLHFCLAAGSKVLTADMRWVPIEDIFIGQEIISTDESSSSGLGKSRRMRTGVVSNMLTMSAPTTKVVMEDGTTFTATGNHKFLCKWGSRTQAIWKTVEDLCIGDNIRRICEFDDSASTYEDGWFGGLLDGEGSLSRTKGSMRITVSQVAGPVLERAKKYLTDNHYKFSERVDSRRKGRSSKLGDKPVHTLVVMRSDEIIRLLVKTKPVRWSHAWWDDIELPRCTTSGKWSKVVSIESAGTQTVYDLETSTHTFIVSGLVTHNTGICRLLSNHRVFFWPDTQAIAASVNEDMVGELFRRDKLMYDGLPWFLRPRFEFDTKNAQLTFQPLGSGTLYHQANGKGGMGMGRALPVAHMTEVAFWDDFAGVDTCKNKLDYHLRAAIPQSPSTLYTLESTSNGLGGWWYDQIQLIIRSKSTFELFFCPWFAASRKYRRTPPEGWQPSDDTKAMIASAERVSFSYLGRDIKIDKLQAYWYESEKESYEKRLAIFYSNYPTTLTEAFQSFGSSAFSPETLSMLRRGINKLVGAYDIV